MAENRSLSPMEAVDEYFDMLIKSRFIEMFGSFEKNAIFNDFVVDMIKGPFGSDIKKSLFVPKSNDTYKVYIQGNAIRNDENLGDYYISKEYYDQKMYRFQVHPKDYIVTCDGTMGKYIRLSDDIEPGIISASLLKLTVDESAILPRFFEIQWEKEILPSLLSKVRNGCLCHLPSAKVIGKERVKLPSLEEQKIFVEFVEQVDKSKAICKQIFQSFDNLVKSRFIEMFGTLDLSTQKSEWKEIGALGTILTGSTPKTNISEYWDGDIRWITPAELRLDSFIIDDTDRKITEEGRKSCSLNILKPGTVLLTSRAPIGKVAIAGTEMYCNQGFKNIDCGSELNNIYLYTLLKHNTEYLNSLGRGATFKEISAKIVSGIRIPAPPRKQQDQFEDFVRQVDKSKFEVVQSLLKLKDSMKSSE